MENELELLNNKLVGQFISRFSVGDTWDLLIGDYWLSAHTIEFKEERKITKLLKENYNQFNFSVDKEDVSKSTIVAANLRKLITRIDLDEMKNLIIDFKNGSELRVLTNTDIVDWQWCINKSGKNPYTDFEIACFWKGEIKIKE
ncbi:hypothetical protein [Tenacibaculum sp. M341]|uniref:hypothetical protein n=1 Tax=Tenacibaculum sp. M341 TaxID=2530339 RepID=UPI001051B604|nr:hypothetical protein [Tenacibaculum sp. M341]TCI84580.1 hypothetical protein EYW44_20650 [Tenacibaculum sp. M341]